MSGLEEAYRAELARREEQLALQEGARRLEAAARKKSPERERLELVLAALEGSEAFLAQVGMRLVDRETELVLEGQNQRLTVQITTGRYQVCLLSLVRAAEGQPGKKAKRQSGVAWGILLPIDPEDCEWFDTAEEVVGRLGALLAKAAPTTSRAGLASQLRAIDHVQIAIPVGGEAQARPFYGELLGLTEVSKPPELAKRGGCWFEAGAVKVHLGVEQDFRANVKAHVAFEVDDVAGLAARASAAGYATKANDEIDGVERVFIFDPFGNRLEFLKPLSAAR